ncbi:acyl-CoA dehydrogenase [Sapientia aquatica]|uniref:Acyl-CoA dehydrogenase n=1 Tax=Sapientia aquatica TaxID=1549640 RepID=A0A4V3AU84_9BURK|nr:acyl-CoA dehydrogenase [Sapientia aquatica]TDK63483.1 acyl-CoA dehydrogenase [Sapientia aquatica]
MSLRSTIDFMLYDWLDSVSLTNRNRFIEHSRETFDATLDMCERIAREKYAPFNRLVDIQEPRIEGDRVVLPEATYEAHKAYAESGMLSAAQDADIGGMQLPHSIEAAANAFFACASIGINSSMLTSSNANLLMAHGSPKQQEVFARQEYAGRWSGTMCLSEPQAGSSLSDIVTRAVPDDEANGVAWEHDPLGPRYRLRGNKMWISAGDHELTENIVHLVLAKIPDAEGKLIPGTRGISLFIVPKRLVTENGELTGDRNDVALAGLNHKLGWRGTTNTLLNFGEGKYKVDGKAGAIGYLVGEPGKGLACMFHMMNQARIAVGIGATALGLAGYYASLDYARNRPQGRPILGSGKDSAQAQISIIQHADVKRMLLAQKSYGEGALALALYCARLVDEQQTGDAASADDARLLLDLLTPIAKSWPSEWCLEGNSLAIQIHGGYGYTRDFAVEQYWRDNRLNMIHEGTHGIQALDLLGRKVLMENGRGMQLLAARVQATIIKASAQPRLTEFAQSLGAAVQKLGLATQSAWSTGNPQEALANAVPYMQAMGHTVLAWIWLDQACCVLANDPDLLVPSNQGRIGCTHYFYRFELPKISAWLNVVSARDMTCADFPEDAF